MKRHDIEAATDTNTDPRNAVPTNTALTNTALTNTALTNTALTNTALTNAVYDLLSPVQDVIKYHGKGRTGRCGICGVTWPCHTFDTAATVLGLVIGFHREMRRLHDR